MILNKARLEFEKRIEQGESISFNFSFNDCSHVQKKRRVQPDQQEYFYEPSSSVVSKSSETRLPSIMTEEEQVSITTTVYEEPIAIRKVPRNTTTRKRSPSGAQEPGTRSRSNSSGSATASQQTVCCLIGCENPVTNRLRFSLRCHSESDFKSEFIALGMNKVCHYHYFADLYQYKKATRAGKKLPSPKKTSSPPSLLSAATTAKRSRAEFEAAPIAMQPNLASVHTRMPMNVQMIPLPPVSALFDSSIINKPFTNTSYAVNQRCSTTATTPVKVEDARVFFDFVELNQNTSQQQRAM